MRTSAACRVTLRRDECQALTNGWSAAWSQSGTTLRAVPLDWNRTLAPGASTDIGYQGTWTGSDPDPTALSLDGTPCSA